MLLLTYVMRLYVENSVDFVCNERGGTFQKPILATVSCGGQVQTYYACPLCMARISKERKKITTSKETVKKTPVKLKNNVKCRIFWILEEAPEGCADS